MWANVGCDVKLAHRSKTESHVDITPRRSISIFEILIPPIPMGKKYMRKPKGKPKITDNPIALYQSITTQFLQMMMGLLQIIIALETVLGERRRRRLEGLDSVSSMEWDEGEGGESEEEEHDPSEDASPPDPPLPVPSPEPDPDPELQEALASAPSRARPRDMI